MFRRFITLALAVLSLNAFAAVDVNKATQAELETVKGIGPGLSTKILDARKASAFKDWTDFVDRVPGIGSGNHLVRGGAPSVSASPRAISSACRALRTAGSWPAPSRAPAPLAAHAHAAQQAAHRCRQAAQVPRGDVVQPLAGRDHQRLQRPQRRVGQRRFGQQGQRAVDARMRSMSTASASRKMLDIAWPAICARLG
jgi:competence protein ComEA